MSDMLAKRGQALENAFFIKRDQELLAAFQTKLDAAKMSEMTGIDDDQVLENLEKLGVTSHTLAALGLVPLVEVAWADGQMADAEREAIEQAAAKAGVTQDSPSGKLLRSWLESKPSDDLRAGWKDYVAGLKGTLSDTAFRSVHAGVMGRAKKVAEAAGGLLGIGAVAPLERKALADLESAFD